MTTHDTEDPSLVALVGLTPPDLEYARDAVELAGARVSSNPAHASLVLASPGAPVPPGAPCVRVGDGGQVSLPVDTALLVSLIAEAGRRWGRAGAVWVVAGTAGGVGVTSVVRLLARECGRRRGARERLWRRRADRERGDAREVIVVDASGSVPGFARACEHDAPGVRWADLDAGEDSYLPSLRDHLPTVGGVRALVGDARGGAGADDPRVVAACRSLRASLIVDAGRWDARAARCASVIHADALVLLTRADLEGASAMAASLASHPPPCPAITLVSTGRGRRSSGLHACAPRPILRAPTHPGRDLRALRRALASLSPARSRERPLDHGDAPYLEVAHA